jgi:hypothetical protein
MDDISIIFSAIIDLLNVALAIATLAASRGRRPGE